MAGVRTTHKTYDDLAPKWQRCSDCIDGQDALHEGGEKYLPKLTDETPAAYAARLKRSDYFNATYRTVSGLTGMAFRIPPVVTVPGAIEPFLADIDMAGCSLHSMAKKLVADALEYGLFGLLVDHPPAPENVAALSLAAAEQNGMRPFVRYYEIESVINWRYSRVNNRWVLTMVVLKEEAEVEGGDEFEPKCEDRYRVLDLEPETGLYRQRVFRIDDKNRDELVSEAYPMIRGQRLPYIPFKIAGEMEEPPLIDLVDANIAHYQVNSDYRHGLHFTGLPTLFLAGVQLDQGQTIYIGGSGAITAPDPNAKAQYVEFSGQGLSETREALRALEQRMAVLGARMIVDNQSVARTATEAAITHSGENSILASIVTEVSETIEWALGIFAEWAGAGGEVSYQINREFNPAGLDAQQLTALLANVQAGKISDREFYELLQRHDVIDAAKPFDEHQAEIDMQGPAMPGLAA